MVSYKIYVMLYLNDLLIFFLNILDYLLFILLNVINIINNKVIF